MKRLRNLGGLRGTFCCLVMWLLFTSAAASGRSFPAPAASDDDSGFGAGIQRTMSLLATSTPEHRNRVRILFYGQSITVQKWWRDVADDLRRRFPHADLQIENRAIGGFASQLLVRIAEHDLYPFYPDLLVFHVYGDHRRYEDIIANVRRATAAEIAIYTDHLGAAETAGENGEFLDTGWTAFMAKWLPENAGKYNCELIDIRPDWKKYLKDNGLEPKALLRDGIHLNDHGNFLLAELVKRHLVCKPSFPADPNGTVKTYTVGRDVSFADGKLTFAFTGNRVDVIAAAPTAKASAAEVFVDGKKPSQFPQAYVITRPSACHNVWPAIIRVSWDKPLLVEDWTLRVIESEPMAAKVTFEVCGSKTGYDGAGVSDQKFVSDSGCVVIEPNDWHLERTCKYVGKPLPENFEVKWKVTPMFVDEYAPIPPDDLTKENVTTLIQGISNGKHTLELIARGDWSVPIRAIRIYKPPLD